MKITATLLLLLALPPGFARTGVQSQSETQATFDSFHSALGQLTKRFKNGGAGIDADIAKSLAGITSNVEFLEAVMKSRASIPKEYSAGVALDAKLLKKLAGLKSTTESERRILYDGLKEVESDLALKVTGPRGSGEVARVVEVLVHAVKGDQEVAAYEVWYVLRGWATDSSAFQRFDRLTNPAHPPSMNIAPGNYFIWLHKGQPVTGRQPVSIGVNGEVRREIELVIQ